MTVNQRFLQRQALPDDAPAIAEIWNAGWHDGHDGLVTEALVLARDPESFYTRAAQRVGDARVAVSSGELAGFVMVVSDEVEQSYVAGHRGTGVAGLLLDEAERQIRAAGAGLCSRTSNAATMDQPNFGRLGTYNVSVG